MTCSWSRGWEGFRCASESRPLAFSNIRPARPFCSECLARCAPQDDKRVKLFPGAAELARAVPRVASGSNQPSAARTNDGGAGAESILQMELATHTGTTHSNRPAHPRFVCLFFLPAARCRKKRNVLFP